MQGLPDADFSFRSLFVPLTKKKVFCFIFIIGLILFFNPIFDGFINDDIDQIVNNVAIHSLNNISIFFSGSTFDLQGQIQGVYYRPLTLLLFAFLYSINGANPVIFHLFQLMLHIINVYFVFLFLKRFFKTELAFLLSLIALIHPINQETVVYISALQDQLFFFFGMSSLLLLTKYKKNNFTLGGIISFLLLMSLLSKEAGLLFCFVFIIYAFLFKRNIIQTFIITATSLLLYILIRFIIFKFPIGHPNNAPISFVPFSERIINIPSIIFYYIKTFLFPQDLAVLQSWIVKTPDFYNFFLPLIFLGIISAFLIYYGWLLYKQNKKIFTIFVFFNLWLVVGILPYTQIFPLDLTVSDNWFYFAIVGALGVVEIIVHDIFLKQNATVRKYFIGFFVIIYFLLFVRTYIRNTDWITPYNLYSHDIKVSNDSPLLENSLAYELLNKHEYSQAGIYLNIGINQAPEIWNIWNNLGDYYTRVGDYPKAEFAFRRELELIDFPYPYINLAHVLLVEKKYKQTQDFIDISLKKYPQNPQLWFLLGIAEYKLGNKSAALTALRQSFVYLPTQQTSQIYNDINNNKLPDLSSVFSYR